MIIFAGLQIGNALAFEPDFQKGMCFVDWEKERYASEFSDQALEALARTGASWVEIVVTRYQSRYDSTLIFSTDKTPSDRSLIHAIEKAHSLGLKVMLKPHIDLLDESAGLCRSDIGFQCQEDWQAWFSSYLDFIVHYARIAKETEVKLFCVGTELSFASGKTAFWQDTLIPAVRREYPGKLVYAANWDEYRTIRFWGCLLYTSPSPRDRTRSRMPSSA